MKKFLIFFIFLFATQSILYSQELQTIKYEDSDIYLSGLDFSENWKAELDLNTIQILNGTIKNRTTKNYKNLILKLYLIPAGEKVSGGSFEGYHIANNNFKLLDKNSSLIGVKIQGAINPTPPNGAYYPVLVLTNLSGRVMNFKVLDNPIQSESGIVTFMGTFQGIQNEIKPPKEGIVKMESPTKEVSDPIKEPKVEAIKEPVKGAVVEEPAKPKSGGENNQMSRETKPVPQNQTKFIPNPDATTQITVADDKSLSLDNQWQVEINPKDFIVGIKGGDISNWSNEDVQNLTLDVFLTDKVIDMVTENFTGLRIASANIGEIEANKKFEKTEVKAGMINIPQSGTYHILLTVSSTDKNGQQVVRTGKYFGNPVSF